MHSKHLRTLLGKIDNLDDSRSREEQEAGSVGSQASAQPRGVETAAAMPAPSSAESQRMKRRLLQQVDTDAGTVDA